MPESGGLRSNWDDPRDPAASLADLTLGRACPVCAAHERGRHMVSTAMVIGGDKFSGKAGDWADVKTEIVSTIANAGFSYMRLTSFLRMGSHLLSRTPNTFMFLLNDLTWMDPHVLPTNTI
jgi:hypothetical protein